MISVAKVMEELFSELQERTYTATAPTIPAVPHRAKLNSADVVITATLAAPGGGMVGKVVLLRASDITNGVSVVVPAIGGNKTIVFNQANDVLLVKGATATKWKILSAPAGAAMTQTFATADRTIPAVTSHAITDSSGGTASTSAIAAMAASVTGVDGTGSNAASKANVDSQLVIVRNNIATLAAELALTKADLLADKKNLNAVIDSLQLADQLL